MPAPDPSVLADWLATVPCVRFRLSGKCRPERPHKHPECIAAALANPPADVRGELLRAWGRCEMSSDDGRPRSLWSFPAPSADTTEGTE